MFSSIDELLEDEEELEETVHPSRLDSRFIAGFGGSVFLLLLAAGMAVVMGTVVNVISMAAIGLAAMFGFAFEVRRVFSMYHFTSKKIVKEVGVFNKDIYSIPYSHIIEVTIEQDIEERIFSIGDLHIKTAGTDSTEMILIGMRHPGEYKRRIGERLSPGYTSSTGQGQPEQPEPAEQPQGQAAGGGQSLESELGRIALRKKELQERYENGDIGEQEYRREWYKLEGAEEEVMSQMDERSS